MLTKGLSYLFCNECLLCNVVFDAYLCNLMCLRVCLNMNLLFLYSFHGSVGCCDSMHGVRNKDAV